MNSWNVTGTVKNFGIKGTQFRKLWISLEVPNSPKQVFINFDLDPDPASRRGKIGHYVESTLDKGKQVFIHDVLFAMNKFSKKDGDNWISEEKIGLKGQVGNITFLDGPTLTVNTGVLVGKVSTHTGLKMIVDHSYLIPKENKWKIRPVPILIEESISYMFDGKNLTGKKVFINGQVMGSDTSVFALGKQVITL